jgi:predicted TIM-barrel fold metal-dependent hydrolase
MPAVHDRDSVDSTQRRMMKFFDSIVHATEDGRWLGATRFDAGAARLFKEMDAAAVDRACLVGLAGYIENSFVASLAKKHPDRLIPIASTNPSLMHTPEQAAAAVGELRDQGFAGVKLHPRLNSYDPLDPRCLAAITAAGDNGLVVFLDTLFRQSGRRTPSAPDVIDRIANACPNARIVLLHGGGPSLFELAELVRIHERLLLDVSYTIMRYRGSSLDADLRWVFTNLDRRTVVGSDFPEHTPQEVLARVEELTDGLAETKRQNLLYQNLESLFGRPKVDDRQGMS